MKQYKDELLASCLTFVLSLHPDIIAADIKAYCPALEVTRPGDVGCLRCHLCRLMKTGIISHFSNGVSFNEGGFEIGPEPRSAGPRGARRPAELVSSYRRGDDAAVLLVRSSSSGRIPESTPNPR